MLVERDNFLLEVCEAFYPVSGDKVSVLYTDGTTEARSPSGSFFGEEGLRDAVMRESGGEKSFEGFVGRLLATLDDYTGHNLEDDVAMVALRFDGLERKGSCRRPPRRLASGDRRTRVWGIRTTCPAP